MKTMVPDSSDKNLNRKDRFKSDKKLDDIIDIMSGSNQCRFCFGEDDTEQNPLLSPC